jgi:predicted permease
MLQQIFAIIAPVLVIALLGYIWERRGMPFDHNIISYLCSYIGAPCLLLHTLMEIAVDMVVIGRVMAAAALLIAMMALVGWGVVRALKLPEFGQHGVTAVSVCVWSGRTCIRGDVLCNHGGVAVQRRHWHR